MQEHDVRIDALCLQLAQKTRQLVEILGAIARIDAYSQKLGQITGYLPDLVDSCGQQGSGKVIDAVITEVFENVQSDRLSGPGKPADNNQAQVA